TWLHHPVTRCAMSINNKYRHEAYPASRAPYPYLPSPVYRPRAGSRVWPFLVLLALVVTLLGGLAYVLLPLPGKGGLVPDAQPRAVTPRGELASDEKATIELFKAVSPSVVHITNLSVQRDLIGLNVQQVKRGTGTGMIWDTN